MKHLTALHTKDAQRDLAAKIRALLTRIEGGRGLDYALGVDVLDVFDAQHSMGNPVVQIDAALALGQRLNQDLMDIVRSIMRAKAPECTPYLLARMACSIVLRVHIAMLERRPA
jgi:hypothetical protein